MNKIIKTAIIALFSSMLITSCDLDKSPYDRIPINDAWQSVDDAVRFRNGLYSSLRNVYGGIFTRSTDFQSDIFNATISYSNRGGDLYTWTFTPNQYDIEDIWEYNYIVIANANNILNNIDAVVAESDEDQVAINTIKGEAYLIRAIAYHNLVIRFANDYEPSTAATDLGLPLVFEVDPIFKPERATLQATYDHIKEGITEARKLITTAGSADAIRLSVDAIDAFEARVNLYMHEYASAITLADKVIAKYPLVSTEPDFKKMWMDDTSTETIFQPFQSVDERVGALDIYLQYSTGSKAFSPDFVPAKWVLDLYESNDFRTSTFFMNDTITCTSTTVTDVYMLSKYPGNPALKKGEYEYYNKQKVFRSAEAYLIAAEASYRANNGNAVSYLNKLREKRGASLLSTALSGDALFDAIKSEWIREFIGEGKRLDDLKRWHLGFKRGATQNSSIIFNNFVDLEVPANAQKFVWEIPANDLNSNKNLIPNWGE